MNGRSIWKEREDQTKRSYLGQLGGKGDADRSAITSNQKKEQLENFQEYFK